MGLRSKFRAEIRKHTYGKQAFDLAAEGKFQEALELIDQGGNVNYTADYGFTGSQNGHPASGSATCNMGFIAIEKGNNDALKELLKRHLDPNGVSREGGFRLVPAAITLPPTMLILAIHLHNQQAIDLLVKAGARTDMKPIQGYARKNGMSL